MTATELIKQLQDIIDKEQKDFFIYIDTNENSYYILRRVYNDGTDIIFNCN